MRRIESLLTPARAQYASMMRENLVVRLTCAWRQAERVSSRREERRARAAPRRAWWRLRRARRSGGRAPAISVVRRRKRREQRHVAGAAQQRAPELSLSALAGGRLSLSHLEHGLRSRRILHPQAVRGSIRLDVGLHISHPARQCCVLLGALNGWGAAQARRGEARREPASCHVGAAKRRRTRLAGRSVSPSPSPPRLACRIPWAVL